MLASGATAATSSSAAATATATAIAIATIVAVQRKSAQRWMSVSCDVLLLSS